MRDELKEDIRHLSELIRKANNLINPEDSVAYLQKKDLIDRLYGQKPKCFLKLQPIGRDVSPYLLPLCNRAGFEDPKVIGLTIKLVQKIMTDKAHLFDPNDIQKVLNKLNHRNSVLSKEVPKPMSMGAKKAKVTRMFKRIKQHLDMNKLQGNG